MSLLILTQKVDSSDPLLGFFHRWIEEFARYQDSITVICLEEGHHKLPANVRIFSLGKEKHRSRSAYVLMFYKHIWRERKKYDSVFVHMNQEYILATGWLWFASANHRNVEGLNGTPSLPATFLCVRGAARPGGG